MGCCAPDPPELTVDQMVATMDADQPCRHPQHGSLPRRGRLGPGYAASSTPSGSCTPRRSSPKRGLPARPPSRDRCRCTENRLTPPSHLSTDPPLSPYSRGSGSPAIFYRFRQLPLFVRHLLCAGWLGERTSPPRPVCNVDGAPSLFFPAEARGLSLMPIPSAYAGLAHPAR